MNHPWIPGLHDCNLGYTLAACRETLTIEIKHRCVPPPTMKGRKGGTQRGYPRLLQASRNIVSSSGRVNWVRTAVRSPWVPFFAGMLLAFFAAVFGLMAAYTVLDAPARAVVCTGLFLACVGVFGRPMTDRPTLALPSCSRTQGRVYQETSR
jgi:hypothetical protein